MSTHTPGRARPSDRTPVLHRALTVAMALLWIPPGNVTAADTGAIGNGDWSAVGTWTNGVPGSTDNAYIGSTYPNGAATTAAVTLSRNSAAGSVYVGDGFGTIGTFDLNGFKLTANNLVLGWNGGNGSLLRTGGGTLSISVSSMSTIGELVQGGGGSFSFVTGDVVQGLDVAGNSTATTAAVGNVTHYVNVDPTSSLNLGANLNTIYGMDIRGTVNANGHALSAPAGYIYLGYNDGPFALNNRGAITASNLVVSSEYTPNLTSFNLITADKVTTFALYGVGTALSAGIAVQNLNLYSNGAASPTFATATTSATGNVTGGIFVDNGCTLTLGANLNLTGGATVNGMLNANGRTITAGSVTLNNWPLSVTNRGPISTTNLTVSAAAGQSPPAFNLGPSDGVTGALTLNGVSMTLPANASVQSLSLNSNGASPPSYASASTTATGNITNSVSVADGCTLTLGADLSVIGAYPTAIVSVSGTLNANGHAISAQQISFGNWPLSLVNRGPLTTTVSLGVSAAAGQIQPAFSLAPSDTVAGSLFLGGVVTTLPATVSLQSLYVSWNAATPPSYAAATTSATTNVSSYLEVVKGCSLTLGADLSLSGTLDWAGTINAAGHAITAQTINVYPFYAIANRGPITAGSITVLDAAGAGASTFNPLPGDAIGSLTLQAANCNLPAGAAVQNLTLSSGNSSNSTATTSAVGNLTNSIIIYGDNTLNLGADLKLTAGMWAYGTVNANGHAISASSVNLVGNNLSSTLANRGPITTGDLEVGTYGSTAPAFTLTPSDAVASFALNGANTVLSPGVAVQDLYVRDNGFIVNGIVSKTYSTAATTTTSNVSGSVYVFSGSLLTLGADLNLTDTLRIGGTLDAQNHATSATSVNVAGTLAMFANDGPVSAGNWNQNGGARVRLNNPGDVLGTLLLSQNSALTVGDAAGQMAGLTIGNPTRADLSIAPGSDLMLEVNGLAGGWVFRWADPAGGNHLADLQGLISGGEITFIPLNGGTYGLTDDGTYTYISLTGVPEPSSLLLNLAAAGLLAGLRRRQPRRAYAPTLANAWR